jgi:hypothetical protein
MAFSLLFLNGPYYSQYGPLSGRDSLTVSHYTITTPLKICGDGNGLTFSMISSKINQSCKAARLAAS